MSGSYILFFKTCSIVRKSWTIKLHIIDEAQSFFYMVVWLYDRMVMSAVFLQWVSKSQSFSRDDVLLFTPVSSLRNLSFIFSISSHSWTPSSNVFVLSSLNTFDIYSHPQNPSQALGSSTPLNLPNFFLAFHLHHLITLTMQQATNAMPVKIAAK